MLIAPERLASQLLSDTVTQVTRERLLVKIVRVVFVVCRTGRFTPSSHQMATVHQHASPSQHRCGKCSVTDVRVPPCRALRMCEGCDTVQSDHAPQAGVAQGVFDGELVRRRVGHQVELEEEQDKEVEGRVRRDAQRTTQVRMHG